MLNDELTINKKFMYQEIDFLKQTLKDNKIGVAAPTNDIIYCCAPTDNKIYFNSKNSKLENIGC